MLRRSQSFWVLMRGVKVTGLVHTQTGLTLPRQPLTNVTQSLLRVKTAGAFSGVVKLNLDAISRHAGSLKVMGLHARGDQVRCVHFH